MKIGNWSENPYMDRSEKGYPMGWNSEGSMNHYLGCEIPEEFKNYCEEGVGFEMDDWNFSHMDYLLIELDLNSIVDNLSAILNIEETFTEDLYFEGHKVPKYIDRKTQDVLPDHKRIQNFKYTEEYLGDDF